MVVNGEKIKLENPMNVKDFLTSQGYDFTKVAVERNGDIIPKATFSKVLLYDEDTIEVVRFVGGG
ncbi:MAG: sulfur carrier protein ThiS [Oscillospiraceae bacterium]